MRLDYGLALATAALADALVYVALLAGLPSPANWAVALGATAAFSLVGGAVAGAGLRRATRSLREDFSAGNAPISSGTDAVLCLVAVALLLTPGLVTDLGGLCLAVPAFRQRLKIRIGMRVMRARMSAGKNGA